ncbi:MAG: hypothetical protein LBS01_07535 [Prevotellaceae bacterium]|jgi:hypothetical protein|nr:hypothetical protein [Prevotellaceae bacterium]
MHKEFKIVSKGEIKNIKGGANDTLTDINDTLINDTLISIGESILKILPRPSIAGTPATQSCSNFGSLPSACDQLK